MKRLLTKVCAFGAALAYGVSQPMVAEADTTTDKPSGKPFVVCSFNMRTDCGADKGELTWTNRLPRILKVIEDHRLDIIGAQELKENQVAHLRPRAMKSSGADVWPKARARACTSSTIPSGLNAPQATPFSFPKRRTCGVLRPGIRPTRAPADGCS